MLRISIVPATGAFPDLRKSTPPVAPDALLGADGAARGEGRPRSPSPPPRASRHGDAQQAEGGGNSEVSEREDFGDVHAGRHHAVS